jgi:hypothetical protein
MEFIRYESITETKGEVVYWTIEFDSMEEVPENLRENGLFVDNTPSAPEGIPQYKISKLYVNPATKDLWYEFVDRPLTQDEEIELLKAKNTQLKSEKERLLKIAADTNQMLSDFMDFYFTMNIDQV